MPTGKSINNKSFYGGNETGRTPHIAMPPLDETPAIAKSAPDQWQEQNNHQQPDNPFGSVDTQVPQETIDAMAQSQDSYDSTDEESSTTEPTTQQSNTRSVQDDRNDGSDQRIERGRSNFNAIRDAKERAERERDAMLSQMLEMQQRMQSMQQQQKVEEQPLPAEDYELDIDADALVEGKHVKKVTAKIKNMEQQLKRYQTQSEEAAVESRIRSQFPDFEKVVSAENVQLLNAQYPEIAKTLRDTADIYNKAAAAYTVIKNFGIHKDEAPFEKDRAKAVANSQKPRPLASVNPTQGESPLSKANAFADGMTDQLKEQLRKEMYAARRNM